MNACVLLIYFPSKINRFNVVVSVVRHKKGFAIGRSQQIIHWLTVSIKSGLLIVCGIGNVVQSNGTIHGGRHHKFARGLKFHCRNRIAMIHRLEFQSTCSNVHNAQREVLRPTRQHRALSIKHQTSNRPVMTGERLHQLKKTIAIQ